MYKFLMAFIVVFFQSDVTEWKNLSSDALDLNMFIYKTDELFIWDSSVIRHHNYEILERDIEIEEWAHERIQNYANDRQVDSTSICLLMALNPSDHSTFPFFFIVNMDSLEIEFNERNTTLLFQGNNMIENTLHREFFTGRLGRLTDKIIITFDKQDNKQVKKFYTAYKNYQMCLK